MTQLKKIRGHIRYMHHNTDIFKQKIYGQEQFDYRIEGQCYLAQGLNAQVPSTYCPSPAIAKRAVNLYIMQDQLLVSPVESHSAHSCKTENPTELIRTHGEIQYSLNTRRSHSKSSSCGAKGIETHIKYETKHEHEYYIYD